MSEQTATRLETNGLTYRHGSATFPRSLSDLGHSNDIPVVSACTVASLPAASANMNGSMETEVEKLAETSLIQDMCSGESCPTSLSEDVLSDPAAWKPDRESRVLVKHCIEIEYVHDIVIDHSALVTELEKRRTIAAELERCALENDGDFQRHRQHARWFGIVPSTLKEPRTPSSIARLRQTGDSIRNFVKMMSPATRRRHNVTTDFNSSASSLSGDTPTENGKGMSGVEFSSQGISERNSSF